MLYYDLYCSPNYSHCYQVKDNEMVKACGRNRRKEHTDFDGVSGRKETTWKTKAQLGGNINVIVNKIG